MSDQQCLCETAEHCPVHYCGEHAEELPCFYCQFNAQQQLLANAHRTAIDLVLAHLKNAHDVLVRSGTPPDHLLIMIMSNITAMRDWTPDHAAEVLRETKGGTK